MGTFRVLVRNELSEHRPEVLLVEDDQVVEAVVAQGPDDPLANRVGAGRPHWTEEGLDAQALGPPNEILTLDGVPVAQ